MILLVVDTQKGITDERLYEFERVRSNIKSLIDEARNNHVEVVYVRHDDGPGTGFSAGDDAFEIFEEFAPEEKELIFDKTVNSAFHDTTGLIRYLLEKNENKIKDYTVYNYIGHGALACGDGPLYYWLKCLLFCVFMVLRVQFIYIHIHIHTCIHIYIPIYTYMHTYMYIYPFTLSQVAGGSLGWS